MIEPVERLLNCICHRGGPYADVLPLCLRCSSVYAGVLVGLVFELATRGRGRRSGLALSVAGLALMGVLGLARLYNVFVPPAAVTVFAALWFGAAIAFFAVAATGRGGEVTVPRGGVIGRVIFVALLALCAMPLAAGSARALGALGMLAWAGLIAAFALVNFAVASVAVRRSAAGRRRLALCGLCVLPLIAAEFGVFSLWRALL